MKRLEGSLMVFQRQIDNQHATLQEQTKALEAINKNLVQLNTTLMGVSGTEDKGLYGKVCKHETRIARLEKLLWPLIAILVSTNVITLVGLQF